MNAEQKREINIRVWEHLGELVLNLDCNSATQGMSRQEREHFVRQLHRAGHTLLKRAQRLKN